MDSRTAETPMEFEWQHRQPGDANSAFYRVGLQHENKKRNYSAFGSPEKKTIPSLRAPNSHPFLFSHPSSPSPFTSQPASQTPRFGQSAWTTPRKPTEIDFSSGAEFSSPDQADNEDTPEQPVRHQRQNSLFNNRGRFAPNASPGRGEIRKNTYSDAVARRVFKKRRQRDKEIGRRVRVDSDDESDRPSSSEGVVNGKSGKQKRLLGMKREGQVARTSGLSQLFEFLERHPNMPSILSWWAQLMLNVTIFSIAVWVVWSILQSIRSEFNHRAELESGSILTEIHQCAKDYLNNGCESPHRAPALTTLCNDWQRCMDRDPAKVAHAQLSAATMAIIINSFIEPISWKAVIIFLVGMCVVTVVSNWSLSAFRNNLNQQDYMQHSSHYPPVNPDMNRMYHHAGMLHSVPNYGFSQPTHQLAADPSADAEKENAPLMLESANMEFVTERSRDREAHLRSPSPTKRSRQFL